MKKNNKGFSLAELIVVVLILGILAVAVTPQVMNWIDKSKVAKDKSYAGTVSAAVESVALEYVGLGQASKVVGASGTTTTLTLNNSGITKTGTHTGHTADALTHSFDSSGNPVDSTFCFHCDVENMIGKDKCRKPEQSGKENYQITVTITGGKTVTVTVDPTT